VLDGEGAVDSSVPPPAPTRNKLRPWYLVAAMVLTWFIGVYGINVGFGYASFLRGGTVPDPASALHSGTSLEMFEYAELQALKAVLGNARITYPLAVAEVILSGLLVVASGLAMGGRRGARSLALQAIGANALLAIVAYALTPAVRVAYIDGFLHAIESVTLPVGEREALGLLHWRFRVQLVLFNTALALGALALTRPRTKTYFEAVARATESSEEP
jgi:hypothetical protein